MPSLIFFLEKKKSRKIGERGKKGSPLSLRPRKGKKKRGQKRTSWRTSSSSLPGRSPKKP